MQDMKKVLFVCLHNSGRSQMAEAFFNQMADGKAEAVSAGTDPAVTIDATVLEAMLEIGLDLSRNSPKMLHADMLQEAAMIISMGCGEGVCPASFTDALEWDLEDPKGKPIHEVREIRDEIRKRVTRLLKAELRPV